MFLTWSGEIKRKVSFITSLPPYKKRSFLIEKPILLKSDWSWWGKGNPLFRLQRSREISAHKLEMPTWGNRVLWGTLQLGPLGPFFPLLWKHPALQSR